MLVLATNSTNLSNDKGYFTTESALNTAYPVGQDGWYATVGTTDTIWVWDSDLSAWYNSGNTGYWKTDGSSGFATGDWDLGTIDLSAGRLDIGGAGEFGNIRQVRIHNDAVYSGLRITNATTGVGSNKGFEMSTYNHDGIINLYEDGDMRFYVHNVERMVLDSAGNLDIDGDYSGVDVNITGDIYLDDTKRINIGNSNDLQLTHSGSVSYIKSITSNYDLAMSVNDGGITKYPIWIDASTSSLGIWNTSLIYPLDVSGVIHGSSNILAGGNFGSNVLEPTFPFESVSKANFASGTIINKTDPKEVLEMRRARGSIGEPEDTEDRDILSLINSWGYYSRDWRRVSVIRTQQYGTGS